MIDWGAPLRDCIAVLLLDKDLYRRLTGPTADTDHSSMDTANKLKQMMEVIKPE